jgi:hypothetical protein
LLESTVLAHLKRHQFCRKCERHIQASRLSFFNWQVSECNGSCYFNEPTDMDNLSSAVADAYPIKCRIVDDGDYENVGRTSA